MHKLKRKVLKLLVIYLDFIYWGLFNNLYMSKLQGAISVGDSKDDMG